MSGPGLVGKLIRLKWAGMTAVAREWTATVRATGRGLGVAVARIGPPAAFLVLIAWWLTAALLNGLTAALDFQGVLGDGPLQLFNPLRRIAAGQRGGADFQFFHGIAVPYLHYPIFALGGKTIFASELARQWVSTAQLVVGYLGVFAGITRRVGPTLGLTAAALILSEYMPAKFIGEPSHSLIGLRSVVPLLLTGLLVAGLRPVREAVAGGALAAVGLLLGTEHGLVAVVMLALVWVGRRWAGHSAGTAGWAFRAAAAFAVTLVGLLVLIAGPAGAMKAMAYAFHDLPADQFWYFGAPPNSFLAKPAQFGNRPLLLWAAGPVLVLAAGIVATVRAHPPARPVGVVLLAALVGGALGGVGYLGYDSRHYLLPVHRMAFVVGLAAVWYAARWAVAEPVYGRVVGPVVRVMVAGSTVLCLLAGPTESTALDAPRLVGDAQAAAGDFAAGRARLHPRLSDYLAGLTGPIDADRAAAGITRPPVIWSAYAGLLEDRYGVFHPHTDYIIHAIGPAGREEYVAGFRAAAPDYVVTFRRDFFPHEEWLQNSTWPFYEELVMNYDVRAVTRECVLWRRRASLWTTADPAADRVTYTPDLAQGFTVHSPPGVGPDAPLVVEVEYTIQNPIEWVPLVGKLPRYLLGPTHCRNVTPVSLPPYRTTWSFPVFPLPGRTPTFYAGTFSLVGVGRVTVTKLHVRPLKADGRERALWDPAGVVPGGGM